MAHYKKMKYPAFLLFALCMSLNAFGSAAVSSPSGVEEEKGERQHKRVCIAHPSAPLSLQDLKDHIQILFKQKSRVLMKVLPEARQNLASIEQALLGKIKGLRRETDFKRMGELAAFVSGVKGMDGSSQNILVTITQECKDDHDLAMAGIAVSASGALKEEFRQLTALLAGSEDTRDIDCSLLEGAIKEIHEITKDIYNAPVE